MDNLGEVFQKAREEKGLTVKDVSIQTNIGSKFIKAIENNDFSVFPGEAYTIGFIRNYAEFLKVDPESVIKLFYTNQIAESETPIEELVAPTKPKLNPIPIILISVFVVAVIAAILIFTKNRKKTPDNSGSGSNVTVQEPNQNQGEKTENRNITFNELPIYSKKTVGDKLYIEIGNKKLQIAIKTIDNKSVKFEFSSIGDNDFLVNMRRIFGIEKNKELRFDLQRNKTYDFSIGVEDVPNSAQAKIFVKKIDTPYESQRYYDYFTYTKPDQATLTQLQQENKNENQTNIAATGNTTSNVKLNLSLANNMQRDSVIYVWIRKDNSTQINTLKLAKNQRVSLEANNKIILDTNNLFGLNISINGKQIKTRQITNDGGVGKLRFWVDKSSEGKTEIKWEINR